MPFVEGTGGAKENLKTAEGMYGEMGVNPSSYWPRRAQEAIARIGL